MIDSVRSLCLVKAEGDAGDGAFFAVSKYIAKEGIPHVYCGPTMLAATILSSFKMVLEMLL